MIKKKILSLTVALVTAVNICASLPVSASSAIVNIVTGDTTAADMTSVPAGFTGHRSNPATLSIENGALKIVGSSANSAVNTGISLTKDHTYAVEAKMKSESGEQKIDIESASSVSLSTANKATVDVTESWTTVSAAIKVTANSKYLKFVPQNAGITWYIDDLEVYDITDAKELTVPSSVSVKSGAVEYNGKWYANPDSTVKFTSADPDATFSKVEVTYGDSNTVGVISESDDYSFTMPNEAAVISATVGAAVFAVDSWSLEGQTTGVDPFTKSVWIKFSAGIDSSLISTVTITPELDADIKIDSNDNRKINISVNETMDESTTYTVDFSGLKSNKGSDIQGNSNVSFTTEAYPSMTFTSVIDGKTNVGRDAGSVVIKTSHSINLATVNSDNVTISPSVTDYSVRKTDDKEITLTFGELAANTTYTISVSEAVKSSIAEISKTVAKNFEFTTGQYATADFVSSSIADNATGVSTDISKIELRYSADIDAATVSNKTVTVSPSIGYTATATGKNITVTFTEKLSATTQYVVTVTNDVKAKHNMDAQAVSVTFTTDVAFENMIKNGGFDDTDEIDLDDAQGMKLVSIVELDGERVLKWKPSWAQAPLYLDFTMFPGHKYFMTMDLKSDTEHTVKWQGYYHRDGDDSDWKWINSSETLVPNSDFVTVAATYQAPSSGISADGISARFRLYTEKSGGIVWVDNVGLYDMTTAPAGTPSIAEIVPNDGATDVSPFTDVISITFDKPMDPTTLGGITVNNGATVNSVKVENGFTVCKLSVSNLSVNKTYTVTIPDTVYSMNGSAITAATATFTTWSVGNTFGQVTKGADNMDVDGKLDSGVIHLVFPEYVNKNTLLSSNFTVSYTVNGGNAVTVTPTEIIKGDKDVKLVLPKTAIFNDATYTVALSSAIKSMSGVALSSGNVVFATKGAATFVTNFVSISSAADAKNFMENDYKDMLQNNDLYDSIIAGDNTAVKNAIYADLATHTSTTGADIVKEINDAVVVAMANNSKTADEAKTLITSAALGLDSAETDGTNIINIYKNTMTDAQRAEFDALINAKTFTSVTAEGIKNEIAKELVLFMIRKSESWLPVQQTFENSKTYFGTNSANVATIIANANTKNIQANVYRPLQGYAGTGFDDLYTKLNSSYNDAVSQLNSNQGSYTSGGGGGGGSFSGPASVTNTDLAQNEKKDDMASTVFGDLGNYSWAIKAIENLYAKGIVSGKGEGIFAPGEDVTRNEFVKMMVTTVGKYDKDATADFVDLPVTHWSYAYVASAVNAGLVNGIGEGMFGTDGRMSRQDVAVLVYNAVKDKNIKTKAVADFKDIDEASDYAKDAVTFLRQIGVVNGDEKGYYKPQSALTRAEAVVILNAVLAYFE